jgi:hypothetical protein
MAVCEDCSQDMLSAPGCSVDALILQGQRYSRRTARRGRRCGDCNAAGARFHHLGCDLEDCPRCGHQLITCGCGAADDETEGIVAVVGDTVVYPEALRGLKVGPDPARPWG